MRTPARQASTAVRVSSAAGLSAAPAGSFAPRTQPAGAEPGPAMVGAVSLSELARDVRGRATTSTTRPTAGATTGKATTTTTSPKAATTKPVSAQLTTTTLVTPLAPVTTMVEKVTAPAVAVSAAMTRSDSGVASWFGAPVSTCAHRTLPMGTVVKVTRTHNGASASCTVDDRGPTLETGRLIDLSLDTFAKLADPEAGLIDVSIQW